VLPVELTLKFKLFALHQILPLVAACCISPKATCPLTLKSAPGATVLWAKTTLVWILPLPMLMVLIEVPVPIFMVSAPVAPVPIFTVSAPVPVAMLTVFAAVLVEPAMLIVEAVAVGERLIVVESRLMAPELYVARVRSEELKVSPATRYIGAWDLMYEAVGLVKLMS